MSNFVAIDFETANNSRNSACAVGLVHVINGNIVEEKVLSIRPLERRFTNTRIHGLTWHDVRNEPSFEGHWETIAEFVLKGDFIAAHNAGFDRSVLNACCKTYGLSVPAIPFACTVQLARNHWGIYPTKLPDVCDFLGIPLQHHDAGSDTRACAKIVIAAEVEGWEF